MPFHYVYILQSLAHPEHFYIGFTRDLRRRLTEHNSGKLPNTSRFKPWEIKSAHAFRNKATAQAFEKHLKTASGRAFAKKRL